MTPKKLSLGKETLRHLDVEAAAQVAGAMISGAKISCMDCQSVAPGACTWWPGCGDSTPTGAC